MAIRTVVTRGYGNGTFNGTIPLVATRGYAIGEEATPILGGQFVQGQAYHPGVMAGDQYTPGLRQGDSYKPGFQVGESSG